MLAGDLVKLVFLATHGLHGAHGAPEPSVYGLTGAYVAGVRALILIDSLAAAI